MSEEPAPPAGAEEPAAAAAPEEAGAEQPNAAGADAQQSGAGSKPGGPSAATPAAGSGGQRSSAPPAKTTAAPHDDDDDHSDHDHHGLRYWLEHNIFEQPVFEIGLIFLIILDVAVVATMATLDTIVEFPFDADPKFEPGRDFALVYNWRHHLQFYEGSPGVFYENGLYHEIQSALSGENATTSNTSNSSSALVGSGFSGSSGGTTATSFLAEHGNNKMDDKSVLSSTTAIEAKNQDGREDEINRERKTATSSSSTEPGSSLRKKQRRYENSHNFLLPHLMRENDGHDEGGAAPEWQLQLQLNHEDSAAAAWTSSQRPEDTVSVQNVSPSSSQQRFVKANAKATTSTNADSLHNIKARNSKSRLRREQHAERTSLSPQQDEHEPLKDVVGPQENTNSPGKKTAVEIFAPGDEDEAEEQLANTDATASLVQFLQTQSSGGDPVQEEEEDSDGYQYENFATNPLPVNLERNKRQLQLLRRSDYSPELHQHQLPETAHDRELMPTTTEESTASAAGSPTHAKTSTSSFSRRSSGEQIPSRSTRPSIVTKSSQSVVQKPPRGTIALNEIRNHAADPGRDDEQKRDQLHQGVDASDDDDENSLDNFAEMKLLNTSIAAASNATTAAPQTTDVSGRLSFPDGAFGFQAYNHSFYHVAQEIPPTLAMPHADVVKTKIHKWESFRHGLHFCGQIIALMFMIELTLHIFCHGVIHHFTHGSKLLIIGHWLDAFVIPFSFITEWFLAEEMQSSSFVTGLRLWRILKICVGETVLAAQIAAREEKAEDHEREKMIEFLEEKIEEGTAEGDDRKSQVVGQLLEEFKVLHPQHTHDDDH
ncbi:unnamed protein product [Amoebophrya sp. A120]|nr:unnamed protein product [Amoebophrya sp. A120]|eukprot:GSA120T00009206001.1